MKISIIIPYHEGESYLRDCLDSLSEQAVRDMEVLLICDRVKEKELEMLSDYEGLSIRVHRLKGKTGVAAARNLGLEKACGEYVYFLDSDDYLYGDTLEKLLQAAQDWEADIVYGKKIPTWFGRAVFLARKLEQDAGDEETENEGSASDTAQLDAENGGNDRGGADRGNDDTDNDDTDNGDTDNDDTDNTDKDKAGDAGRRILEDDSNSEDGTEEMSEEELFRRKEARIRKAYRVLVVKRKGVRNISVLGILFRRSFIEEHHLRFPENIIYLSDAPFLVEALSKTERFCKRLSAKYIKRKHNDAINLPSLSQVKDPNRFFDFLDTYYETIKRIPPDSELRYLFDRKYIMYYTGVYAPKLKRSMNSAWREENFIRMSDLMNRISPRAIRSVRGYKRRIVKALMRRDVQAAQRIVTRHLAWQKLKRVVRSRKALYMAFYFHVFMKRPMKNYILFESFFGKNYSDSPKYIYEYLAKHYPDQYKFIWVINKRNTRIPYRHRKIRRYSLAYYYYLACSRYYVFNGRQPEWVIKRPGNIFLQTWHGTPLKKLVFDIEEITSATPKYKQQVYKQSRAWDYLIAPNAFCSVTFRRCFMYENQMLETGYPRNDILHDPDREELSRQIRSRIGIPQDKKAILYAPTWRDDEFYGKGQYKFELNLDLEKMRRDLGEEYVILLRTHYFIADSLDVRAFSGFAYNLSRYDDISELYLISDILITDYSSVFFDYANLKRPMLFYTYDLEKYRDVLRGFYFDIEKEVPGPLLFTTEEVVEAVRGIDEVAAKYQQRYDEFYNRFCAWEDGHAAKKVVESVFRVP